MLPCLIIESCQNSCQKRLDKKRRLCYDSNEMRKPLTFRSDTLVGVHEAARFLGVSRMTIWRWSNKGKLHPVILQGYQFFEIDELKGIGVQKKEATERQTR